MPDGKQQLLAALATEMPTKGWLGRMPAAQAWITEGNISQLTQTAAISVIAVRRNPKGAYQGFEILRKAGIPFQSILVDVGSCESQKADIHLCLAAESPWYSAYNLGAALACGNLLIFIDGDGQPDANLIKVYKDLFQTHPQLVAARGRIKISGLTGTQTTGSFELAEDTTLWPLDLDENMAIRAPEFFQLGGFDEAMQGGYGSLDLSIRLFGKNPRFNAQRYAHAAVLEKVGENILSLSDYLTQRHRSWLELNEAMKRYLELYGKFWQANASGETDANCA